MLAIYWAVRPAEMRRLSLCPGALNVLVDWNQDMTIIPGLWHFRLRLNKNGCDEDI
jgi:hypothetical protein